MWVGMDGVVCAVLREAYRRQVGEAMGALSDGGRRASTGATWPPDLQRGEAACAAWTNRRGCGSAPRPGEGGPDRTGGCGMTQRRDEDRDELLRRTREEDRRLRDEDRRARDEQEERRAETERRGAQLREAWRRHHPQGGRDKPKRKKP